LFRLQLAIAIGFDRLGEGDGVLGGDRMTAKLIVTGDVNLMNVADPVVPFAQVAAEFRAADLVFSNLECCLYAPPSGHSLGNEGFFADPQAGIALTIAGIGAVGIANNVHYGEGAILSSIARLDALGVPHTGAGADLAAARAPVVVERNGIRYGFLQRSSVYWPTNQEAQQDAAGIAVIRGHTAYHVPVFRTAPGVPPPNRPGVPPQIVTWADADYLARFREDIAALRPRVDILVASCHWGLGKEVLQYMREIAHAAIEAGADVVAGHGPHYVLPIEVHAGRPIFYGLGSFSFHTGHGGHRHGDWVGMMVRLEANRRGISGATVQFVRHSDRNETFLCRLDDEAAACTELTKGSASFGGKLVPAGDELRVILQG
jgi:poly-gamma-glutamate capsule biosynthesis protein CapA/YwtB (metallophosphatase superfamily)